MASAASDCKAAIAALYDATRGDRPQGPVEGCPCCVSSEEMRALQRTPRETAPPDLLGRFAFKAMSTWGTPRDFRWFLPRILELLAGGETSALWPGLVTDKILSAGFAAWAEPERRAIRSAFAALFRLRPEGGAALPLRDLLTSCVYLGVDVDPLVEELSRRALDDPAVARDYVKLVEDVVCKQGGPGRGDVLSGCFWNQPTLDHIEELFFRFPDGRLGERLSFVAQCLELARDAGRLPP